MGNHQKRLREARARRREIASVFDALKNGRVTLESLLENPPRCLGKVTINQVMMHAPGLGPEGIKKCLKRADVWPEDRLSQIPTDARLRVVEYLPPRARKFKPVLAREPRVRRTS